MRPAEKEQLQKRLQSAAALTEAELNQWLSETYSGSTGLADAMRYSVLGGGKRIRAFLTLEFARVFGASDEAALPFACAIEMVHAYSLVHDDMPCMDNDDMRRGKPSCHKAFGEANALLAGDTLLTQAFEVAASNPYASGDSVLLAVREIAKGAGALGMAGGQYYDLAAGCSSLEELFRLQNMKTGALIRTAALLGYYAAESSPNEAVVQAICTYAENIGLAFQIVDDLLDVNGSTLALGKPVGSDQKNGKKTILSFLSPAEAQQLARTCTDNAKNAVQSYTGSETLCALAEYLLERKS